MFYSHAEKVRIAMEVLASCQAEGTTSDFLSMCQKRGIIYSNRDTLNELFEFEYNVLMDVPGGKRAFKESLVMEAWDTLCYGTNGDHNQPGWKFDCLLHNLASYTDIQMATSVYNLIFPYLESYFDDEAKRTIVQNQKDGVKTSIEALNGWRTARRAEAYVAIAARPMTDAHRMREMQNVCYLRAANPYAVSDALNIHIGLFGYNEQQARAVMNPRKHYRYRIGTWMAVMTFLENTTGISLTEQYGLAFMPGCNVIRDLAGGTSLPDIDAVFGPNGPGAPYAVIGRQVPFYYRQYYSAKEKLEDAYREMRGINISL